MTLVNPSTAHATAGRYAAVTAARRQCTIFSSALRLRGARGDCRHTNRQARHKLGRTQRPRLSTSSEVCYMYEKGMTEMPAQQDPEPPSGIRRNQNAKKPNPSAEGNQIGLALRRCGDI